MSVSIDESITHVSFMVMSEYLAEIVVQRIGAHSKTKSGAVRFGNGQGSCGGVVVTLRKLIAEAEVGTGAVTYRNMTGGSSEGYRQEGLIPVASIGELSLREPPHDKMCASKGRTASTRVKHTEVH